MRFRLWSFGQLLVSGLAIWALAVPVLAQALASDPVPAAVVHIISVHPDELAAASLTPDDVADQILDATPWDVDKVFIYSLNTNQTEFGEIFEWRLNRSSSKEREIADLRDAILAAHKPEGATVGPISGAVGDINSFLRRVSNHVDGRSPRNGVQFYVWAGEIYLEPGKVGSMPYALRYSAGNPSCYSEGISVGGSESVLIPPSLVMLDPVVPNLIGAKALTQIGHDNLVALLGGSPANFPRPNGISLPSGIVERFTECADLGAIPVPSMNTDAFGRLSGCDQSIEIQIKQISSCAELRDILDVSAPIATTPNTGGTTTTPPNAGGATTTTPNTGGTTATIPNTTTPNTGGSTTPVPVQPAPTYPNSDGSAEARFSVVSVLRESTGRLTAPLRLEASGTAPRDLSFGFYPPGTRIGQSLAGVGTQYVFGAATNRRLEMSPPDQPGVYTVRGFTTAGSICAIGSAVSFNVLFDFQALAKPMIANVALGGVNCNAPSDTEIVFTLAEVLVQ